jgi:hypothetical protein
MSGVNEKGDIDLYGYDIVIIHLQFVTLLVQPLHGWPAFHLLPRMQSGAIHIQSFQNC